MKLLGSRCLVVPFGYLVRPSILGKSGSQVRLCVSSCIISSASSKFWVTAAVLLIQLVQHFQGALKAYIPVAKAVPGLMAKESQYKGRLILYSLGLHKVWVWTQCKRITATFARALIICSGRLQESDGLHSTQLP